MEIVGELKIYHGMRNELSGKTENLDKISFKVPFAISKTNLIQIFGFTAQTVPHPTMHYYIHPRSYTISSAQYVGDTCREKEKGQGHIRPKSSGEQFFTVSINTPLPFLT